MNRLINLIYNYARLRGYSIARLAVEVGVSPQTLYTYLSCPRRFRLETLVAVFDVLGIPKEERWV